MKDRNKGVSTSDKQEENPDENQIHSDDPMLAGLANGKMQAEGKENDPSRKPEGSV